VALVRDKYSGTVDERFGPTLAAEHLAREDGVHVHHDTLRRWMVAAGLWSRTRKRSPYRRRRERKAHFGELVQLEGSFHAWFEWRGPWRRRAAHPQSLSREFRPPHHTTAIPNLKLAIRCFVDLGHRARRRAMTLPLDLEVPIVIAHDPVVRDRACL
jgi:hypothetical protein